MRMRAGLLLLALATGPVVRAAQPATLERVRQAGVLRCGSAIRPGLAFPGVDHAWSGLLVDLCRAVAVAAIGPDAKVEFNGYALRQDFDRSRGADDVAFLTGTELYANGLFGALQMGPPVFFETSNVMVWDSAAVQRLADLGGQPGVPAGVMVCAEPGTGPDRNLLAYARAHGLAFQYSAWQELEEMMDAFNVGRCPAVTGEVTALAALRLESARLGHPSRILAEPLAVSPVLAATPQADPAWSALVGWTMQTVLAADNGLLPVDGAAIGLDAGWQARVIAATGPYADLFQRNLGADSVLDLPRGTNARWDGGGLLAPATVE